MSSETDVPGIMNFINLVFYNWLSFSTTSLPTRASFVFSTGCLVTELAGSLILSKLRTLTPGKTSDTTFMP